MERLGDLELFADWTRHMRDESFVSSSTVSLMIDNGELRARELLQMFGWILDSGSGGNELHRLRLPFVLKEKVACRDQPPDQEGEIASKYPFECVRFVHHHRRQRSHEVSYHRQRKAGH